VTRLALAALVCAVSCRPAPPFAGPDAPPVLYVGQVPGHSDAQVFTSLQEALDAAPAGTLVRVGAGEFPGPIRISRSVRIAGEGAGRTFIAGGIEVRAEHVELRGMTVTGGASCIAFRGGGGHRLAQLELRSATAVGLAANNARIAFDGGVIRDIGDSRSGRGIDVDGGSIEVRGVVFRSAGRRAIVLRAARGLVEDADVRGSALSAVQATAGAEVRVVRGRFEGLGGAALYAGGARLRVDNAVVEDAEYGIIGFRGAEVSVRGGSFSRYRVAGIALVGSHGSIEDGGFARGGSEGAISISYADGDVPVAVTGNRIQTPGPMGIHVTDSAVTVRGNSITGARHDAEGDLGDALFALDARLLVTENVLRGNAGSGVAATRTKALVFRNGFIENRRAGLLLLDRSRATAGGNLFLRNADAVEVGEAAIAELTRNRFSDNRGFDLDVGCGQSAGSASLDGPVRKRGCIP
jgi:hypothetical protein